MRFVLTKHLQVEMLRRRIPEALVLQIAETPEQAVKGHGNIMCHQSRIEMEGKTYLVRVMIKPTVDPALIITVYKTSKINKYWRIS
jgi:hypothetical protein